MKSGAFSPLVRQAIWEREAGMCGSCGRNVMAVGGWVHQHRRARGSGGSKAPDTGTVVNGVLQCAPCNVYTEAHPSWALWAGYRVPQGADPALVPIWIARMGWCLLESWGGYQLVDDPAPDETAAMEAFARARARLEAGQVTPEAVGIVALAAVAGAGTGLFAAWLFAQVGVLASLTFLAVGAALSVYVIRAGRKP